LEIVQYNNFYNHKNMSPLIRPVRKEDAPYILEIYAPYVLETPVTFEEIVPDVHEIVSRIEGIASQMPYLCAKWTEW
jgi:L-amino acid N-acyltransferase YncA